MTLQDIAFIGTYKDTAEDFRHTRNAFLMADRVRLTESRNGLCTKGLTHRDPCKGLLPP